MVDEDYIMLKYLPSEAQEFSQKIIKLRKVIFLGLITTKVFKHNFTKGYRDFPGSG